MEQRIDYQELLDIATRVGVSLLKNGALYSNECYHGNIGYIVR